MTGNQTNFGRDLQIGERKETKHRLIGQKSRPVSRVNRSNLGDKTKQQFVVQARLHPRIDLDTCSGQDEI